MTTITPAVTDEPSIDVLAAQLDGVTVEWVRSRFRWARFYEDHAEAARNVALRTIARMIVDAAYLRDETVAVVPVTYDSDGIQRLNPPGSDPWQDVVHGTSVVDLVTVLPHESVKLKWPAVGGQEAHFDVAAIRAAVSHFGSPEQP